MIKNQRGFSVIEGLLVVIIVGMISAVGVYVWHSLHQLNQTYTSTSTVAQSSPGKITKKTTTQAQNYFTIKEWSLRAPYNGSLTLQYAAGANTNEFNVSSAQLNAGGPDICTTADGAAGYIARYLATDEVAPNETAQAYLSQNFNASNSQAPAYVKIGGYYYIYFTGQGNSCNDQTLLQQTQDAFNVIVPKLQAIPQ